MRKNEVLRLLRSGEYISGEKLGKALGISRVAVCKIIAALREDGFLIDAVPNRGYCLLRQELSQERLASLLPGNSWSFQVLRETDSTNNALKRMCDAAHGTVILTGKQTGAACFLIGSSFGIAPEVKQKADFRLSFGPMTFPHHLMRVMALEQLYRAETIQAGTKYHK